MESFHPKLLSVEASFRSASTTVFLSVNNQGYSADSVKLDEINPSLRDLGCNFEEMEIQLCMEFYQPP